MKKNKTHLNSSSVLSKLAMTLVLMVAGNACIIDDPYYDPYYDDYDYYGYDNGVFHDHDTVIEENVECVNGVCSSATSTTTFHDEPAPVFVSQAQGYCIGSTFGQSFDLDIQGLSSDFSHIYFPNGETDTLLHLEFGAFEEVVAEAQLYDLPNGQWVGVHNLGFGGFHLSNWLDAFAIDIINAPHSMITDGQLLIEGANLDYIEGEININLNDGFVDCLFSLPYNPQ